MIGSESIDLSLKNIWGSWKDFRKGKKVSDELHHFQYYLEKNLWELFQDLSSGKYKHGSYRKFIVNDNKRREISVASIRDRVVHRLIYNYLENIYDQTFIYDAWSCRKGKGLLGAIERTACFLKRSATHTHTQREAIFRPPLTRDYPRQSGQVGPWPPPINTHYCRTPAQVAATSFGTGQFVWKCDIKKFFDSVNQEILLKILSFRIKDSTTFNLLKEIIFSFETPLNFSTPGAPAYAPKTGMPIGNITSQIFANIYLNELDRFVKHDLGAKAYLRYGDDFIIVEKDLEKLKFFRTQVINLLLNQLKLTINPKSDKILKPSQSLYFLGIKFWPSGRNLNKRSLTRAHARLNLGNLSSYSGLVKTHCNKKKRKHFDWILLDKLIG